MKLTNTERLLLINQYELLKATTAQQADRYDTLIHCLTDGYLEDFEALSVHLEPELSETIRTEVRAIFEMFRALNPMHEETAPAKFAGFDGNEETKYYAYASFLLDDLNLWKESRNGETNSHSPMLPDYRKMLKAWRQAENPLKLTSAETQSILEAAPHRVKR